MGSRLRPLTDRHPKALVACGGRPLVAHALDNLRDGGVTDVVVVVGHGADALTAYLGRRTDLRIRYVPNPAYATTNTLASVACAASAVDDDFFLLDGDVVFELGVLDALRGPGTSVAVDRDRTLDDDAVKVTVEHDRITRVAKELPPGAHGWGESIGIARIDRATGERLFPVCQALLRAAARQAYYEAAFQDLIDAGAVFRAADVTGCKWVEIDDHDDLRRAESLFVAA
jgi:choline kinase